MLLAQRIPHLPQPLGVKIVVLGLAGLLRQHRQRPALKPDPELALELGARLSHLARPRRHHLAQRLRHALDLEVAAPVAGARPDRPAGVDECVGDLGAEQRAALQRGVVAKPLPRVGRHQPPIGPHQADARGCVRAAAAPAPDRLAPAWRSRATTKRSPRRPPARGPARRPSRGGERPPCCAP